MKYIKTFESIRDEYPGMFEPRKPEDEPKPVPGFEDGTIDPNDDEAWRDDQRNNGELVSDKDRYKDFLKITRERNFQETEDETIINMKRLWYDFYMSIYEAKEHYMEFVKRELIGRYISKGYRDLMTDAHYEGIIKEIIFNFDGDRCYEEFQFTTIQGGGNWIKNGFCENIITLDKMKEAANKYNL